MNRNDFIVAFSNKYDLSITQSKNICDAVLDFIGECVCTEPKLSLYGLGVFEHAKQKGRPYVLNGTEYKSEGKTVIKFRPSDTFEIDDNMRVSNTFLPVYEPSKD